MTSSHIKEGEGSMFLTIPLLFASSPLFQLKKAETSEADEADEQPAVVQLAKVFAPKSLVLVSRLDHTEVFKVRHSTVTSWFWYYNKHLNVYTGEHIPYVRH